MKTNPPPPANAGSDEAAPDELDRFLNDRTLEERMRGIRRRIVVLSGKGGVGKSTVAVNLAVSLALAGRKVGLLDVDIHGPSIPKLLRLEGARVEAANGEMQPIEHAGLKVMSIGFLLGGRDDAVIWRGPMKMHVIREFLQNVAWGDLDYLIVDSPPGTGDEPLSVCQLAAPLEGAVVVTTPQDLATADVRKSIVFCRKLSLPVLGVVENMSGFVCPACGTHADIFKSGGGERMAAEMGVPFLGRIPIDPAVGAACDDGAPFIYHDSKSPTAQAFAAVCAPILALSEKPAPPAGGANPLPKGTAMKIAIPGRGRAICPENHLFVDADGRRPDEVPDDQALWMETPEGLVAALGCAHAGLVRTLQRISELSGSRRFRAVLGGFHLGRVTDARCAAVAVAVAEFDVREFIPLHCTGDRFIAQLSRRWPDRVTCRGAADRWMPT